MIKRYILLAVAFVLLSFSILAIPGFYYEVKSGDNLEFISKITHTPMQVIIEWNQWIAFRKYLYPGDRIFIPYKPVIIYEVKSGDNLTLIALRFFTTVKDIMKMNNIKDPNKIYVGQRLLIDYYSIGKFFDMKHVISWPIFGEITSEYGWGIHPIFKKRSFHHGVDIAAPEGTPIFAATSGKVIEVGKDNGFGIYVKIRSYKYTYMYAHLSKVSVSKGMIVKKGELIGRVGSTGLSTGPHLHFQIEDRNQKTYNPLVFLPSIKYVYKNIKERYYIGGK